MSYNDYLEVVEDYDIETRVSRSRKAQSAVATIARAERTIERAQARLDKLMSMPKEPTTEDSDGALVIWFQRRFNTRSATYTYAAVKAGDDLWYTTGPASPKGYSWDQLMDWLANDDCGDVVIWQADGWTEVI